MDRFENKGVCSIFMTFEFSRPLR